MNALGAALDPLTEPLTPMPVKPKKTDITVQFVGLAWAPFWEDAAGARAGVRGCVAGVARDFSPALQV